MAVKIRLPKFRSKISRLDAALIAYSCVFIIFSAANSFSYFVDSKNYTAGIEGYEFEGLLAANRAWLVPLLWFVLLRRILVMRKAKPPSALLLCLWLNPYIQLLITNMTKELFIISILSLTNERARAFHRLFVFLAANVLRPIYFIQIASVPKIAIGSLVIALGFLLFRGQSPLSDDALQFIASRPLVEHIGRDFFAYLCVSEKASLVSFIRCASLTFFFVPRHPDFFTADVVIYAFYVISWVLAAKYALRLGVLWFSMFVASYLVMFFLSPTFGAFVRYFTPVLFIVAFGRALNQKKGRGCKQK